MHGEAKGNIKCEFQNAMKIADDVLTLSLTMHTRSVIYMSTDGVRMGTIRIPLIDTNVEYKYKTVYKSLHEYLIHYQIHKGKVYLSRNAILNIERKH